MTLGARWAWARLLENPFDVSADHIKLVYRLNKPCCRPGECHSTCKSSPLCLNGLSRLNLAELADSTSLQNSGTLDHPFVCTQSSIAPNGLKNYGSTCYLNAFLQLYFRFDELRQAVFSLSAECDETGIIYQLQLIFSQLELSKSGIVDPGGLIECLRLCQEEQQDAPEFHCLFMHLLELRFRESGLSVIDELFRGEYVYETKCLKCDFTSRQPSNFLELPLKVSSNSLPGCIRDYMKEESLTGENQYECPVCQAKHDGVRRVFITRAPRLLCIQLLRFTYDPRTGQRKKQKAAVRLPDKLQLVNLSSECTQNDDCATVDPQSTIACLSNFKDIPDRRVYRLCGVLLHIGSQPTSGHYVAVVREPVNPLGSNGPNGVDRWTVCNDTEVYTIPASQFNLAKVTSSSKGWQTSNGQDGVIFTAGIPAKRTSKSCYRSCKKARQSADDGRLIMPDESIVFPSLLESLDESPPDITHILNSEGSTQWHCSSSAYMLFYQVVDDIRPKPVVRVPDHLRRLVEEVNLAQAEQTQVQNSLQRKKLTCLRDLLMDLRVSDADTSDTSLSKVSLVPTQWVHKWFDTPDQPPPSLAELDSASLNDEGKRKPCVSLVDRNYSAFKLCPHGRVPVDIDAADYRAVSTSGLIKSLGSIESSPSVEDTIDAPVTNALRRFQPCRDCVCLKVALIQQEQRIRALAKELDAFARSKESYTCAVSSDHPTDESNSTVLPTTEPKFFWIGRRSLRQWRNLCRTYVTKLHLDSTMAPGTAPHTTFNSDVLCPHKQLRLNAKRVRLMPATLWHKLITLFPGASIPTFPAFTSTMPNAHCSHCESFEESLVLRAANERDSLPRLLLPTYQRLTDFAPDWSNQVNIGTHLDIEVPKCASPQKKLTGDCPLSDSYFPSHSSICGPDLSTTIFEDSSAVEPHAIYLIPFDFIQQWRRFVKNPLPETLPDQLQSGLSVTGVVCEHGQLAMPWWNLLSELLICPISATEYGILAEAYSDCRWDSTARLASDEENSDSDNVDRKMMHFPPIFLRPPTDSTQVWELHPEKFSSVCTECYTRLLAERSRFKNARLRIRLVKGHGEALTASTVDPISHDLTNDLSCCNMEVQTPNSAAAEVCCQNFQPGGCSFPTETEESTDTFDEISSNSFESNKPTEVPGPNTSGQLPKALVPDSFVRRSGRQRLCSNDLVVRASSDQLLQDLKVQLMNLMGVSPVDQHLMLNGVELVDTKRTLGELGICVESLLYLWIDVQPSDSEVNIHKARADKISNEGLTKPFCSARSLTSTFIKEPAELGFKGTRLLNN